MNAAEKEAFVKSLMDSVRDSVVSSIRAGKVPDEWDGIELRFLLRDKFKEAANFGPFALMKGQRLKAYENTLLCQNL